jgi:acyl carrier protein
MRTFNTIVSTIFSIDEASITDGMSSKDIADWDSMNYLMFIAELENEFGVTFSMDEVMNAKTLGDIRVIVDARKK